jgi:hypothetical protein
LRRSTSTSALVRTYSPRASPYPGAYNFREHCYLHAVA